MRNQPFEVGPAQLEVILASDEVLAAQSHDRSIQAAEADPELNDEALDLLRSQRSLVGMDHNEAFFKAIQLAKQTVGEVEVSTGGDRVLRRPGYNLERSLFVPDLANDERWRAIGINPKEYYGDDAYGESHINAVQESWRAARKARAELVAAQNAETEAMKNVLNPPTLEPRS